LNGTIWIDKVDKELTRAEAEMFDTVNVGFGLLGKIEKGTRFEISRRKHADGPWLTDTEHVRFAARVMLLKSLNTEILNRYSEYRHKSAYATPALATGTSGGI
jgi:hypothetical protein